MRINFEKKQYNTKHSTFLRNSKISYLGNNNKDSNFTMQSQGSCLTEKNGESDHNIYGKQSNYSRNSTTSKFVNITGSYCTTKIKGTSSTDKDKEADKSTNRDKKDH